MVIGYGDSEILQETINILDDTDIDFYIHWDKKYKLPKLNSVHSKLFFINRSKVYWGTDTQVIAEHRLFESVYKSKFNYDYVHLISSSDIPLMTRDYFKNFFKDEAYISFQNPVTELMRTRVKYYYPFRNVNIRNKIGHVIFVSTTKLFNKLLGINRLKQGNEVYKGTNWISLRSNLLKEIIEYPNYDMFLHSFLADEIYVQTILSRFNKNENKTDSARYIDWNRGQPYTFNLSNVGELKNLINTKYAFARKVTDVRVPIQIFK